MDRLKSVMAEPFYASRESFQWLSAYAAGIANANEKSPTAATVAQHGGTSIINVNGMLFRYPNILTEYGIATSTEVVKKQIKEALANGDEVLMVIDSGGGLVNGTADLADYVYANRDRVTAFVKGAAASGAYWLASAAGKLYVEKTSIVGSVGVVVTVYDFKQYFEDMGITIKDITSSQSPNKRPDVTTDDGEMEVKRNLDALADIFISSVARNRAMPAEGIMAKLENGGVITGEQAVERGVADGVKSLDELLAGSRVEAVAAVQLPETEEKMATENTNSHEKMEKELMAVKRENELLATIENYRSLLSDEEVAKMKDDGITAEQAQKFILDKQVSEPATQNVSVTPTAEGDAQAKADIEDALVSVAMGGANRGDAVASGRIKPILARLGGLGVESSDDAYMAAMTTSDFPVLLRNAVNRIAEEKFQLADTTYGEIVKTVEFADFKERTLAARNIITTDVWGDKKERGESKYSSTSEQSKTAKLQTKSAKFALTREMIINDDLGEFNDMLGEYVESGYRLINKHVYNFLERTGEYSGYTMYDGKALFHADHGNIGAIGAIPSESTLNELRTLMMRQTDGNNNSVRVTPRKLIVPAELLATAQQLLGSYATLGDNKNSGVVNVFRGAYDVIADPDIVGTAAWYLLASGAVNLGILRGTGGRPQFEETKRSIAHGIEFEGVLDFVVYADKYQYAAKNTGV